MKGQQIKTQDTRQISFPISSKLWKELKLVALNENTTLKDLITNVTEQIVERYKKGKSLIKN